MLRCSDGVRGRPLRDAIVRALRRRTTEQILHFDKETLDALVVYRSLRCIMSQSVLCASALNIMLPLHNDPLHHINTAGNIFNRGRIGHIHLTLDSL